MIFKYTKLTLLFILTIAFSAALAESGPSTKKKPATAATAAINTEYPALPSSISRLFYVQRDPNANTIVYELNVNSKGELDDDAPVHPYWIRYTEKGKKEELNYIQRKFAYGLTSKSLGNGKYDIRFVSYKKFPLTLMKATDGKYRMFANVAQKQIQLDRIFVRIEGGSFWLPNVLYVEIKGTDTATGKEVTERFKP